MRGSSGCEAMRFCLNETVRQAERLKGQKAMVIVIYDSHMT